MSERRAFEAKHYAMRKSKDGTVVSFVVHPNDMTPELNNLPIGARVMIGWAEIGDDEKPKAASSNGKTPEFDSGNVGSTPTATAKPKRKFSDMSLPEQCAMRCEDGRFERFLSQFHTAEGVNCLEFAGSPANYVRAYCSVNSRAELSTNHDAANRWRKLESEFQQWLTDETYKDHVR